MSQSKEVYAIPLVGPKGLERFDHAADSTEGVQQGTTLLNVPLVSLH